MVDKYYIRGEGWTIGVRYCPNNYDMLICGPGRCENVMRELGKDYFNGEEVSVNRHAGSKKVGIRFYVGHADYTKGWERIEEEAEVTIEETTTFRRTCR